MQHNFGYVYVLTNPAMPGLVKIGKTTRRPEARLLELSSATAVPQQFELAYQCVFDDCHMAERLIHNILEEQGLRAAKNREFFTMSADEARLVIDEVARKVDKPEFAGAIAQSFFEEAEQSLLNGRASLSELDDTVTVLEYATSLGHEIAPFRAAELVLTTIERRRNLTDDARSAAQKRAIELFGLAAERGVARGFGRQAEVALTMGDTIGYVQGWERYLSCFEGLDGIPEDELGYVLSFMQSHMYGGERACPVAHPFFRVAGSQLRAAAKAQGLDSGFKDWLDSYVSTLQERLLQKFKWPLVALAVVLLLTVLYPEVAIAAIAAGFLVIGVASILLRASTRRRLKAEARTNRKKSKASKRVSL